MCTSHIFQINFVSFSALNIMHTLFGIILILYLQWTYQPAKDAVVILFNFHLGQSGYQASKYCTTPANHCFGANGQNVYIKFNPAFTNPPKVMIGLTLVDTHKDQNVRVRTSVTSVDKDGFWLKMNPWDISITYQIGVNWMACPWTWTAYKWWFYVLKRT